MLRRQDQEHDWALAALCLVNGAGPGQLYIIHLRPLVPHLLVCTPPMQGLQTQGLKSLGLNLGLQAPAMTSTGVLSFWP